MRKAIFRDMCACVNCKACIIACKVKHMSYPYAGLSKLAKPKGRNLINVYQSGPEIRGNRVYQSFVSIACMCTRSLHMRQIRGVARINNATVSEKLQRCLIIQ